MEFCIDGVCSELEHGNIPEMDLEMECRNIPELVAESYVPLQLLIDWTSTSMSRPSASTATGLPRVAHFVLPRKT